MKYILQFSQSVVLLVTRCPPPWSCWALKASQSRLWHLTLNHPPFPSFRFHANMCCHLWVPALIMKCCSSPSVLDYLHKARKWSDMGEGVCLKSHCYWSERVLVVDAEHHLMHISLEPTRSLASTTFFFFFLLSWAAANSENMRLSATCDERQSTCFSERWGWKISSHQIPTSATGT